METESAHVAQGRRHTASDYNMINMVSHAPFISTNHIIKYTIMLLEKYGLKQEEYFKVPNKGWMEVNFILINGQQRTAEKYTGKLPFIYILQIRDLRHEHPHGHYNTTMKQP